MKRTIKTTVAVLAIGFIAVAAALAKNDKDKHDKPDKIHNVPDSASTLALLGVSLTAIGIARRYIN